MHIAEEMILFILDLKINVFYFLVIVFLHLFSHMRFRGLLESPLRIQIIRVYLLSYNII